MFAHVGQRLLQDVQHLDLQVRRKWQGVALHVERGRYAGLLFELAQGRLQSGLDVLGAGAGAEVDQQFAHIGITLAHTGIDLLQHALGLLRVALVERVLHQLHLDLEEGQRLCDRIVQLTRNEAALLGHRSFLLQRQQADVVHGCRQVGGECLEQGALRSGDIALGMEEQVDFAHQPLVQPDRDRDDRLETRAPAVWQAGRVGLANRYDAHCGAAPGCAAMAVAGAHAMFGFQHGLGQTLRRQHQVAFVGFVRPAQCRPIGFGDLAHPLHEPLSEALQGRGAAHQRGHAVQGLRRMACFSTPTGSSTNR